MIRISLAYLFNLAPRLEPLSSLPKEGATLGDIWQTLFDAEQVLIQLYGRGGLYEPHLRVSSAPANALFEIIRAQTVRSDLDGEVTREQIAGIIEMYSQYKPAWLAELSTLNSYLVTKKGSNDSYLLLTEGESMFPNEMLLKAPETKYDAQEAGKCMAFEVPTACGFHVFRVIEVTSGAAAPKVRNIGVYLKVLTKTGKGDPKIIAALAQIAQLHRNPLIHPEAALTPDEALSLIGVGRSVIAAMLAVMPIVAPTTVTAGIS